MRTVGNCQWHQLSKWDISPANCVESFVTSACGNHTFHYILLRTVEVVSQNNYKTEIVTTLNGVPATVLSKARSQVYVKVNNSSTKVMETP